MIDEGNDEGLIVMSMTRTCTLMKKIDGESASNDPEIKSGSEG
jgi:hypothetical protein